MARSTKRRRAPNLRDEDINEVLSILDGWAESTITWAMLIDRVRSRLGSMYTRQALHRYPAIAAAYTQRRAELSARPVRERRVRSVELQAALDRVARLETKVQRLESTNARLIDQFVTWAYNANAFGITEDQLNRPLPSVHRQ